MHNEYEHVLLDKAEKLNSRTSERWKCMCETQQPQSCRVYKRLDKHVASRLMVTCTMIELIIGRHS